uniref:HTH luxR-type domain-containing protein n=1 Tax=Caenorhabditis japonica TaxID=281687 RepID=A0A2Q4T834_CAEJA
MKSSPHRPSIELLFKRGLGSAEIARRLQISSSTVRNVVAAIKKRGDASEVKKADVHVLSTPGILVQSSRNGSFEMMD